MNVDLTAAKWFKSSRSHGGGECVEAAHLSKGCVGVRDSKLGNASPILVFDGAAWDSFTAAVRAGAFDRTASGQQSVCSARASSVAESL
ncbi:DUF397 domain-containing protein [Nocardia sp. 2]|uniref:DUF397 domain-containing protein n=1 Tax=Nocardia acididurans TaxID=2802282 RepID=A0ABS1MFV5_9NOCA|nr:DUF397 domain-containing protein [Nocardia acididurans]MBL1079447.1 DUF397 domain-containing protein [Nocardia acididurans]